MTEPTDDDKFAEFDTPAEEIDQVIDAGQPVQFGDRHLGCAHSPGVTHSPNMRLRLRMTP